MVCVVGSKTRINAGNILVAALLLFDTVLTTWRFLEESTEYNRSNESLKKNLSDLETKSKDLTQWLNENKDETAEREQKEQQLALAKNQWRELDNLRKKADTQWRYKKYALINDLVYATGLMCGWSLLNNLFFNIGTPLAGGIFLFVLTVAYHAVTSTLEIAKTLGTKKENNDRINEILTDFKSLPDDSNYKKYLYLEIESLKTDNKYRQEMIRFQIWKLLRSTVIDALIPVIVFASLVFFPTGVGVGILAAACALMLLSKVILNHFEPKAEKAPEFSEEKYKAFAKNPNGLIKHGMFAHTSTEKKENPPDDPVPIISMAH